MSDEVKTTVLNQVRKEPPRPRIEDIGEIKQTIIANLMTDYEFIPHEKAKQGETYPEDGLTEAGFLHTTSTLFQVLNWVGLQEKDQALVWKALDELSHNRHLKIFHMEISKHLSHHDLKIRCEVGRALKKSTLSGWKIFPVFYWESPPTKNLFLLGGRTIEKPSAVAKDLREKMNQHFRRRFGWRDFELEKRLRHEDLIEESRLKRAILDIAKNLKKK